MTLVSQQIKRRKSPPKQARVIMPDGSSKPVDALLPSYGGGLGFSAAGQSANRGFIVFPTLDTRREISTYSRTEMLKKSRWLYNNVGFAKRTVSGISRMLGALHPDPICKDAEWKKMALSYFWTIAGSPYLFSKSGKYTFGSYQRFLTRRWLIDGDSLSVLSTGPGGDTQVAAYEAHQIRQTDQQTADNRWYDGVQIDRWGRLKNVSVYDPETDAFSVIPERLCHLSAYWERSGQPRGVTPFHAAITRILDVREVTGDMMASIKRAGLVGFYLHADKQGTTMLGEDGLAGGLQEHLRDIASGVLANAEGTADEATPAKKKVKIEDITAGSVIPEFAGFEPKVLHDSRPAQEQMNLLNWFIREATLSLDYHPEVLWDLASLNGNTSRLAKEDAESANSHYRAEILQPFCQRYWFALIGGAIARGVLPPPANGERWDQVRWVGNKKLTIDRGNEGRLALDERRQPGMRTLSTHFGEQQLNWESQADQWMDEIDYFIQSAVARGWSPARIMALESQLLAAPAGAAVMMGSGGEVVPPGADPEEPDPGFGERLIK